MPKGYIDCHKCKWSHRLYDHTGKWTGAVFCSKRNGKIRKRFRGECKYWSDGKCWNLKGLNKTDGVVNAYDFCSYGEREGK